MKLSVEVRALLMWAMEQGGGYLGLEDIMRVAQRGQQTARRLAERWERVGWIVKDPSYKNKRRVCQDVVGGLVEQTADKLTD